MSDSKFNPQPPDKSTIGTSGDEGGGGSYALQAGAPADIDLLAVISRAKQISQDYQQRTVERSLGRSYRAWRNEHAEGSKYLGPAWRGRSRLFVPKTRSAVRKNLAGAAASLFGTEDVVHIHATFEDNPIQQATAATIKADMDYRLTQANTMFGIPWFLICMGGCLDAQITGVTISKQYWQQDFAPTGETETVLAEVEDENGELVLKEDGQPLLVPIERPVMKVVRDRPMIELCPIENAIIDPAAPWWSAVQGGRWFGMGFPIALSDLKTMMKAEAHKGWLQVDDATLLKGRIDEDRTSVRRVREGGPDRYEESRTPGEMDLIWIQENFVRVAGVDYHFWSIGTHAFLSRVRPVEEVYPALGGERPYVMGVAQIDTHRVFPMSPVESWQPLQLELNDITNLRIDTLKRAIAPLAKVRRGAGVDLTAVQRRGQPDIVVQVDDMADVEIVPTPGPSGAAFNETSIVNANFDELAGVFSTSSVQTSRQLNETVGGMRLMAGSANSVSEFDLRMWVETWVEPVLRQVAHLIRYYETNDRLMLMSAHKARVLQQFGYIPSQADFETADFILNVNVGIGAADPMQRIAKLKAAMEMLAPLFELMKKQGIEPDVEELIDEVMGAAGFKDGRRFFKFGQPAEEQSDPELQKLLLEMQVERERMKNDLMQVVMTLRSEEARNTEDNRTKLQIEEMKGERELAKQLVGAIQNREAREHEAQVRREEFQNQKLLRDEDQQEKRRQEAVRMFMENLGGPVQPEPQEGEVIQPQAPALNPMLMMMSNLADQLNTLNMQQAGMMRLMSDIERRLSAPAEIIRDSAGRPVAVRKGGQVHEIIRDQHGYIAGTAPTAPALQLPASM